MRRALGLIVMLWGCPSSGEVGLAIERFEAEPSSIPRGGVVGLSWRAREASAVSIVAEPGGTILEAGAAEGILTTGALQENTTFTLTAHGEQGSVSEQLQVQIDPAAVQIVFFEASPNPAPPGAQITLSWRALGATQVRVLEEGEVLFEGQGEDASSIPVTLSQERHRYTLEARNAQAMTTRTLRVVTEAPGAILAFSASPTALERADQAVQVTWAAEGALALLGNGVTVPSFEAARTGTITLSIDRPTRFDLIARGAGRAVIATRAAALATPEQEPNDVPTQAQALGAEGGVRGALSADDLEDLFAITVPEGGSIFAELSDGQGGCGFDSRLFLYDAAGRALGEDDESGIPLPGGVGACARIDPRFDDFARDLRAGTYQLGVRSFAAQGGSYALVAIGAEPRCGNALPEPSQGESCDDGNTRGGDGCGEDCRIEPSALIEAPGGEVQLIAKPPAAGFSTIAVSVQEAGSSLIARARDDAGGCPFPVELQLEDQRLNVLGVVDGCTGINDRFAQNLAPGIYWLKVRATSTHIGPLTIDVQLLSPACPNGVPEPLAGEQCDDGNQDAQDGCTPDCLIEVVQTLSGLGVAQVYQDAIVPAGQQDHYRIELPEAGYISAVTGAPTLGQCPQADTRIALLGEDLSPIAQDDDSGPGRCSRLQGATAQRVEAGTYHLRVEPFRASDTIPQYELLLATTPLDACGNGVREAGEQCDDGNMEDNDGCNPACEILPVASVEGMDQDQRFAGALTLERPTHSYRVVLPEEGYIEAQSGTPNIGACAAPADTRLVLLSPSFEVLGQDEDDGPGLCASIDPARDRFARLPAGEYHVSIQTLGGPLSAYELRLRTLAPGCGNGVRETSEQCDDGNLLDGDGCNANCTFDETVLVEQEPNDVQDTAQPLPLIDLAGTIAGAISPVGDRDVFEVTINPGAPMDLRALTYSRLGDPDSCAVEDDTELLLYDASWTLLSRSDDSQRGDSLSVCSFINPAQSTGARALSAGTYYLLVHHYNDTQPIADYFLDVQLLP